MLMVRQCYVATEPVSRRSSCPWRRGCRQPVPRQTCPGFGLLAALFADAGFARTTIRGVATKAKVDPSLVHHYFDDKDGLLQAVISLPIDPAAVFAGLRLSVCKGSSRRRAGANLAWRMAARKTF